jgi:hypothetical protein
MGTRLSAHTTVTKYFLFPLSLLYHLNTEIERQSSVTNSRSLRNKYVRYNGSNYISVLLFVLYNARQTTVPWKIDCCETGA